jgi:hypothetical protein
MNLNLTSKEMEIILSLTANNAHHGEECDSLWRKVSQEFTRRYEQVRAAEAVSA